MRRKEHQAKTDLEALPIRNKLGTSEPALFDRKYANRSLVLFSLMAASILYIEVMLTPSLPKIASDYSVSSAQVSLILSLYTVFGTAINPVIGKLGDIYGKKKILTYVLIAYTVMVTTTSFAPDFTTLLISRTFQGIGLGIFPLIFSLVREQYPRNLVPRAQGLLSAMFGAGVAIGLPIGAFVSNGYGWQTNYHIATPLILALAVLIVLTTRESAYKNANARLDYTGSSLLGLSLGMVVFGISEGATWGWSSLPVLVLMVGGVALLAPLAFFERRVVEPLLSARLLTSRNVLASNLIGLITGLGIFIAFQTITYQLQNSEPSGYGLDIFGAGLYLLPLGISMLVVTYPVGMMISRVGVRPFLFLGSAVGAAGFFLLSRASNAIELSEFLVISSVGIAMLMVARQNLLVLSVETKEMGIATSMNTVFLNVGSSLGAPIAGSLLSTYVIKYLVTGHLVDLPLGLAYEYSYYIAAVVFMVGFLFSLFSKEVIGRRATKIIAAE